LRVRGGEERVRTESFHISIVVAANEEILFDCQRLLATLERTTAVDVNDRLEVKDSEIKSYGVGALASPDEDGVGDVAEDSSFHSCTTHSPATAVVDQHFVANPVALRGDAVEATQTGHDDWPVC
jgi:hypothetical protein